MKGQVTIEKTSFSARSLNAQAAIEKTTFSARNLTGQVTIEYLLTFAVSLSLISISLLTLSSLKDDSDKTIYLMRIKSLADEFSDKVEVACSFGHGFRLSFESEFPFETKKDVFTFASEVSDRSTCPFHTSYKFSRNKILIENVHGEIVLSEA